MFNGDIPISTHSHLDFFPSSEVVITQQTDSAAHKLKLRSFHKFAHLWVHSADFYPGVNHAWQYYQTSQVCCRFWAVPPAKPSVAVPFAIYSTSHFKVQMASSCCNSSTPVSPLGTPFNTISHFSDQIAYLLNALQHSRQIHQRGRSSPRSPSSAIQPSRTVSPVPGPSIVPVDNDPNWEDAPTNPSTNNNITNRLTSSTRSWSKPYWNNNINEQLAKVLGWLANTLNSN